MPSLKVFAEAMRKACEDWSLGYDQGNRWDIRDGGECDCSSLVIWALRQAGFDTGSASYTGDMSDELCARGWKRLPFSIESVRAGDILLNDSYHTCAVIAGSGEGATIAQASIDERGAARGGASGDQTGGETNTKRVYVYRYGWDCILRYGEPDAASVLEVDGHLGPLTVSEWQRQCGCDVDGIVSGQLWDCRRWFPRLESVSYVGMGSALMRVVQARAGVPSPSGIVARGTMCKLQGYLVLMGYEIGNDEAGVLDEGTAKAIQRSLNDGRWRA